MTLDHEKKLQLQQKEGSELIIFSKWIEFLKWLFPVLEKMPKSVRFTLTTRLQSQCFDIVEYLVEAQYSKEKREFLRKVNIELEKLRINLRISHDLKLIPQKSYFHAIKMINEVGMMNGGWIRSLGEKS